MKLTLVCSCGVLLECGKEKLLIDGVNEPCHAFDVLSSTDLDKIKRGIPPFDGALTLLFTHRHPDHYSRDRIAQILAERPNVSVMTPDDTPLNLVHLRIGSFDVEAMTVDHTPVPGIVCPKHMVILVTAQNQTAYFGADADIDVEKQKQFLNGRRIQYGFFNGQYLSHPETRKFLLDSFAHPLIYHIPTDDADSTGIRRKAMNNFERFHDEMPALQILNQYPYYIPGADSV